jgi:hypothetical protein
VICVSYYGRRFLLDNFLIIFRELEIMSCGQARVVELMILHGSD